MTNYLTTGLNKKAGISQVEANKKITSNSLSMTKYRQYKRSIYVVFPRHTLLDDNDDVCDVTRVFQLLVPAKNVNDDHHYGFSVTNYLCNVAQKIGEANTNVKARKVPPKQN